MFMPKKEFKFFECPFSSGTKGRNKGEFTNLQGVAASSIGRILIADSNNQCVQVHRTESCAQVVWRSSKRLFQHRNVWLLQIFSNEGEFKSRFGVRGRTPGQLQRPTGVAVHPSGDIIIADYDNKWVSIFTSEGKFKVCALLVMGGSLPHMDGVLRWLHLLPARPNSDPADSWGQKGFPWTKMVTWSSSTTRRAPSSSSSWPGNSSPNLVVVATVINSLQVRIGPRLTGAHEDFLC